MKVNGPGRSNYKDSEEILGGPRSLRSFSGGIRGRAFTLLSPPPSPPTPLSPSLLSNLASVDVKQYGQEAYHIDGGFLSLVSVGLMSFHH